MHFRLLDGNGLAQLLQPSTTGPTAFAGVQAFLDRLRQLLGRDAASQLIVCWDGEASYRQALCPTYKAALSSSSDYLAKAHRCAEQLPLLRMALSHARVTQLHHAQLEARDLVARLAPELSAQGHLVTLYTPAQLWASLIGPRVRWQNARKPAQVVDLSSLPEALGVKAASHITEIRALAGIAIDGIPAVAGFTEAQAVELLTQYGSLTAALTAVAQFGSRDTRKHVLRLLAKDTSEQLSRNLQLLDPFQATPSTGVPISIQEGLPDHFELYCLFVEWELSDWTGAPEKVTKPFLSAVDPAAADVLLRSLERVFPLAQ